MSLLSWLGMRRTISQRVSTQRPKCRLRVERLEDRLVPANYDAANVPELIAAINAAILTPEPDTIALVSGTTYTLTEVNNTIDGANGLPVIWPGEDLTILGNGSVIERSTADTTPAFRLFDVAAGAALTLQDVTLQGGLAYGAGASASGGAIYSRGTLTLNSVMVQNNQAVGLDGSDAWYSYSRGGFYYYPAGHGAAAFGGGLYIDSGTAVLNNVTLSTNTAQGGMGGDGLSFGGSGGGGRRDHYSGFKIPPGNGGAGLGGALYAAGGTLTVHNTSTTYNSALGGAAGKGVGGTNGTGQGGGFYIEADVIAMLDAFTVDHFRRNKASTSDTNIAGPYTLG